MGGNCVSTPTDTASENQSQVAGAAATVEVDRLSVQQRQQQPQQEQQQQHAPTTVDDTENGAPAQVRLPPVPLAPCPVKTQLHLYGVPVKHISEVFLTVTGSPTAATSNPSPEDERSSTQDGRASVEESVAASIVTLRGNDVSLDDHTAARRDEFAQQQQPSHQESQHAARNPFVAAGGTPRRTKTVTFEEVGTSSFSHNRSATLSSPTVGIK